MIKINQIYNIDCFNGFKEIGDNAIDLIVTSPPYFNARDYSQWNTYEDYLVFVGAFIKESFRVLKDGGRIAINIPDGYNRNPWIPIYADYCKILQSGGLILRGNIVWHKLVGGGRTSWGSWRSSSNPSLIDEHEMIIVAHKDNPKIANSSEIDRDEFLSCVHSVWQIKAETSRKNGHPAPYPIEIPERLIKFLSGEGSLVLDPFSGSGTTAIACLKTNRNYIGFEILGEYFEKAELRIISFVQSLDKEQVL